VDATPSMMRAASSTDLNCKTENARSSIDRAYNLPRWQETYRIW
jgi:hypothetical protein